VENLLGGLSARGLSDVNAKGGSDTITLSVGYKNRHNSVCIPCRVMISGRVGSVGDGGIARLGGGTDCKADIMAAWLELIGLFRGTRDGSSGMG
jgi:hypothetical protein